MDINHLMTRFKQMEAKIERVKDKANTRFDPDVSIIISGIHYEEGDNVMGLVKSQWNGVLKVMCKEMKMADKRFLKCDGKDMKKQQLANKFKNKQQNFDRQMQP